MSDSRPGKIPKTQPASAGGPPRPPKKTARGLSDESPEGPHIDIPDPVILKELATALGQRPFRIVADVLELGRLVFAGDPVDFETATTVAKKYGYQTRHVG
jgi:translation initiation factor IF-2